MHEPLSVLGEMRSRKHARLAIVRLVDSGAHPVAAPLPSQPWPGVDFVRAYLRDSTLAPRPRVRADACQHDATGLPPLAEQPVADRAAQHQRHRIAGEQVAELRRALPKCPANTKAEALM